MDPRRFSIGLILLALIAGALAGCAALVVGGAATGALVAHDRRSASTVLDDRLIAIAALDRVNKSPQLQRARIRPIVYNGVLLLVGEVREPEHKPFAEQLLSNIEGVRYVVNELDIQPAAWIFSRSRDAALTAQVKAALLRIDGLPDFDATRVKVVSVRRQVYLMGLLRPEEAEASVNAARRVTGVERVVQVFEYLEP